MTTTFSLLSSRQSGILAAAALSLGIHIHLTNKDARERAIDGQPIQRSEQYTRDYRSE